MEPSSVKRKFSLHATLFLVGTLSMSAVARAGPFSLEMSSGIAFSARNDALDLNPAALVGGETRGSLRTLWTFQDNVGAASLVAGTHAIGIGAGYRQTLGADYYQGGLGIGLGLLKLGTTVRGHSGSGLDGDVAANIDLSSLRIAVVARGVSGGLDRLDLGLGWVSGRTRFEVDLKKPWGTGSSYLADIGLAYFSGPFTFSLGSDCSITSNHFSNFQFHSGVAFMLGSNFSIEGAYRPAPQETGGKYVAGARFIF